MWLALGIVSLFVFFGYRLWRKLYWAWGWTNEGFLEFDRQYYRARAYRNGSISYAVVCPAGFYFRIKRESRWDRLAKRIGLSAEHQLADAEFDEHLYLVSNDPGLISELTHVPQLRDVVKTMFRDKNVQRITCEGRHLWVELRHAPDPHPLTSPNARIIVSALHAVANSLNSIVAAHGRRKRDPYILRAVMLVAVASTLLLLAVVELYRTKFDPLTIILDSWSLFGVSATVTVLFLFLFLAAATVLLRGSAHAHVVMLEILLSGGLGVAVSSYMLLREINLEFDRAESVSYAVTVVDKQISRSRKSASRLKLYVVTPNSANTARVILVDRAAYAQAKPGHQVLLFIKPGALGFRWLERVEPLPSG